jgi:hypothetical protein
VSAHHLRVRGRIIPVVLPTWNDPRLRLAAVLISLQVLGQVGLRFKLSIAQILVTIGVCALVEVVITYGQQRALIWPASAILTGNSTAFILRANGTQPGDWWSLNGIEYFILAALIGILSKYLIRFGGRHLYNPSNLGLVLVLLIVGATHVFPQYLWWGPLSLPVVAAVIVILVGAVWVLRPLQMLAMVAAFLVTFAILIGAWAGLGRCFLATWHPGPVCGWAYWLDIVTSPELLVFVFFMISDPRTSPRGQLARLVYAMAIAVMAAVLIWFQPSEFGIKVALLAGLTVICSFVPLLDRIGASAELRSGAVSDALAASAPPEPGPLIPVRTTIPLLVAAVITLGVPAGVSAIVSNPLVLAIDGGRPMPAVPGATPVAVPKQ